MFAKKKTWNRIKTGLLKVRLLGGVSFKANKNSGIRSGHIYACHDFGIKGNLRPRYDFVSVSVFNDETQVIEQELAQVLALIEVKQTTKGEMHYAAVVQYLREDKLISKEDKGINNKNL